VKAPKVRKTSKEKKARKKTTAGPEQLGATNVVTEQ